MSSDEVAPLAVQHAGHGDDAVAFATVGTGPPVLLLLGFLPPLVAQWYLAAVRRFVEGLAVNRRVILVGDRYYVDGQSEVDQPVPGGFLDRVVADVRTVIGEAGSGRCPVIASYLATIPAVALAARHPGAVESLLLWDGLLTGSSAASSSGAEELVELHKRDEPAVATRAWVAVTGMTGSAKEVEEYHRMFTALRAHPAHDRIAVRGLAESDAATLAPEVTCPTLIVFPERAVLPGPGLVERLARAIPGARVRRLASAAVAPHLEEPSVVLPLITEWLDEQQSPARRPDDSHVAELTPRELEVCQQIALGRTNLEIAEALSISRWTVQRHVSNAIRKTGASNRAGLAALVAERRNG